MSPTPKHEVRIPELAPEDPVIKAVRDKEGWYRVLRGLDMWEEPLCAHVLCAQRRKAERCDSCGLMPSPIRRMLRPYNKEE